MYKITIAFLHLLLGLSLAGIVFFAAEPFWGAEMKPLALWLLALGLVTFVFYGYDKMQSKGNGRRIPEWALHGLALSGGVGGGGLGMLLFRHKTQKPIFRLVLFVAILLWAWLVWR